MFPVRRTVIKHGRSISVLLESGVRLYGAAVPWNRADQIRESGKYRLYRISDEERPRFRGLGVYEDFADLKSAAFNAAREELGYVS